MITDIPVVPLKDYGHRTKCSVSQALALVKEADIIWLHVSLSMGADPLITPMSRDDAIALIGHIKSKQATVYARTVPGRTDGRTVLLLGKGRKS